MKINLFDIYNFRKLKKCRLEISDKETVFVGANNSGKTAAMDMLIRFLVKQKRNEISTIDFTLSNWLEIEKITKSWVSDDTEHLGTSISEWQPFCPTLDVWIEVKDEEVYYVSHLIPTLSWSGGKLGVRLSFEPDDIEKLQKDYISSYNSTKEILSQIESQNDEDLPTLWPNSMRHFLEKRLKSYFKIKAYLLDPSKFNNDEITALTEFEHLLELDVEPFEGLFKIDFIEAQRGFSDSGGNSLDGSGNHRGNLSKQLKNYYYKHLDPFRVPTTDDLSALQSLDKAKSTFDNKLNNSFTDAINEISNIGYPGFTDPKISLTSKIKAIDNLDHDTAIQFDVLNQGVNTELLKLPEKLNGLGYKNLISIIFELISFRDGWMRVGKASDPLLSEDKPFEPLHLVLVEEPEAHLHAQVQQVFINKAYSVLRNHINLQEQPEFTTQLLVSTHSSYLAKEVSFSNLRYFKRIPAKSLNETPYAIIINMSDTFGKKKDETAKFVSRYIKTTHCDLFFANGIILVEGAAERMLLPHFIKGHYGNRKLSSNYISILEVNGAHAHRLRSLIEKLGINTLIITDLDSKNDKGKKDLPNQGQNQITDNDTLKSWLPQKEKIDDLISLGAEGKIENHIRVAYQYNISVEWNGAPDKNIIPYTFEDALVFSNIELFKEVKNATGMLKKMVDGLQNDDIDSARKDLFDVLDGDKAKMALDILFSIEPEKLTIPKYIDEGLVWLESQLNQASLDFIDTPEK